MSRDIIQEAIKRFKVAQDYYDPLRQAAREDLEFVAGKQWESGLGQNDDLQLTVNLLGPFLRQITSEARSANPAIRVVATGSGADEDKAEVYGGLIKHIEQFSEAEVIYQQALWYAAAAGEGYMTIDSEYCSDESFDQDLVIKGVNNPEKVFLDPLHEHLDGHDSEWAFIVEDVGHDAYERQFPNSQLTSGLSKWNLLDLPGDWLSRDLVRVAKYWVKEYEMKTIYLVLDPLTGEQISTDEEPDDTKVLLKKRQSQVCTVKCYLINASEVLEETEWPGKYIPIIKVTGDTYYVGGEKQQYGAIRFAKDPQRQYNYFTSRQTEMVDLAPKNAFVGATGQFANNPEKWANANRENYGFLDYTPVALNNQPLPAPTRVSGLDMNAFAGVAQSRQQALEDLKLTFGLHDAALGRVQGEASGVAQQQRVEQSSRSTYQYFDHFLSALRCLGRQLVGLIPHFYDTERTVRIVKPTTEEAMVLINSMKNNQRYDLTYGSYDVTVTTGPAYASKRQEAYDAMQALSQVNPQVAAVIGDLQASQIDSPVSKQLAARIKATIPKEVLAATGEDNDAGDMAPKEQLQKVQQDLSRAMSELEKKDLENQELQVKVRIAEDKSALELTKMDTEYEHKGKELQQSQRLTEMEFLLKQKELELKERELDMAEKQLQLKAIGQAHEMNESSLVHIPDTNSDTNLGGSLD
jgi:hypothetical protein